LGAFGGLDGGAKVAQVMQEAQLNVHICRLKTSKAL